MIRSISLLLMPCATVNSPRCISWIIRWVWSLEHLVISGLCSLRFCKKRTKDVGDWSLLDWFNDCAGFQTSSKLWEIRLPILSIEIDFSFHAHAHTQFHFIILTLEVELGCVKVAGATLGQARRWSENETHINQMHPPTVWLRVTQTTGTSM